jgi:uncharacterized protein YkvS
MQSSNIYQSIWKQDNDGEWRLFFDGNQTISKNKPQEVKTKKLTIGSLVMSPEGIGRYVKNLDNDKVVIKLTNPEKFIDTSLTEISTVFHILIKIHTKDQFQWYRLELPVNADVLQLEQEISKVTGLENYALIYNGFALRDDQYFEELKMKNNSKVLLFQTKGKEYKLSRVTQAIYSEWYSSEVDSIIFNVDKKIRLSGIGYFVPCNSATLSGKLKLCEVGDTLRGNSERGRAGRRLRREGLRTAVTNNLIGEVEFQLPSSSDANSSIAEIKFKKPIQLMPFCDYVIVMNYNSCDVWYTSYDKEEFIGEKEVVFNFKHSELSDSSNCNEGNFPEFYYYV